MFGSMYEDDYLGSDDLEGIMEISRQEESSSSHPINHRQTAPSTSYSQHQDLSEHIADLETEIRDYDDRIGRLQHERQACVDQLRELIKARDASKSQARVKSATTVSGSKGNGVNYLMDTFVWSDALEEKMREVFGIQEFRLCQRGVCNAAMDDRDIVCIMPTGGGKSLTYQLPALFGRGVTLVISPLISLITDQIMHLRQAGVEAVKLTGSTSKSEANDINRRLRAMADRKSNPEDQPIKLCYVTPEKIGKSNTFKSLMNKLAAGKRLDRIVIDEAHCVSQLGDACHVVSSLADLRIGHDFRPDYGNLHILRQLCPGVPITSLSATCPPEVLEDLVKTLGLRPIVDGLNAAPDRTTLFTAPLYRKNLHYRVVQKPATFKDAVQWIVDYIQQHHAGDTGIVYCCSKKDTEEVAQGLYEKSEGKIKTGVYHADKADREKEALHEAWHRGQVKVVCATIAFGLGIDKGDVRFVIHEKMSKSLDGYYQESGRAGRDGNDSDCVLLYRPQDYSSLGAIVAGEKKGQQKLKAMVEFAENVQTCRKVQFADYFSFAAKIELSSWSTDSVGARDPCGHCDNCSRDQSSIEQRDLKVEAWQILKVTEHLEGSGGNATVAMLANLARGKGGASVSVSTKGKGKARAEKKGKVDFDLMGICEGPVNLTADETERLILQLLLKGYLKERIHVNAYTTIVYLVAGPHSLRMTRLQSKADVEKRNTISFECFFPRPEKKARKTRVVQKDKSVESASSSAGRRRSTKGSHHSSSHQHALDEDGAAVDNKATPSTSKPSRSAPSAVIELSDDDNPNGDDDEDDLLDDWTTNQRGASFSSTRKRPRASSSRIVSGETTILVIDSSDED